MTIPTLHFLEPAYSVIQKLGGKTALANDLQLFPSTLSRWCQPTPAGTGGRIPQKYWRQLFEIAKERGVDIKLEELAAIE